MSGREGTAFFCSPALGYGIELENNGRFDEALTVYSRELLHISPSDDAMNYGVAHHQMGNCNAALERHEDSLRAYVTAARTFEAQGDALEFLINSLSELGYLLVDYDPPNDPAELFDSKFLRQAILPTVVYTKLMATPELEVHHRIALVRRAFGVGALYSFTGQLALLSELAQSLRNEITLPFEIAHPLAESIDPYVMWLDTSACAFAFLSEVPAKDIEKAPLAIIEFISAQIFVQRDPGWTVLRSFDWFAAYLRRKWHMDGISAKDLSGASIDCFADGHPFELPGYADS